MNSHRICWFVCFSLMLAIFVIGASGPITKAEVVEKSWISGTIEATKKKDLSADEFATRAYSYSYRDCVNVKGQEWVSTPWWVWTPPKELVTNEQCVAQTANGYFGQDNTSKFVIPYGSSNIQRVYGYDGYDYRNSYMYPVPNTNRILYLTALGFYAPSAKLNVINDWNETYPASTTLSAPGNVQRNQVKDFDYTLSDENGAVQGVSLNGLTSSANGEWAAVLASNRSYLLLNMTTHETISFDIDDHSNYSVHMAASNDGKFAAKASWQNTLKLYDTTKCQPSQPSLASRSCEAKELLGNQGDDTVLRRLFPGKEIIIGRLLFVGNGDALDVDMHVMDGTSDQYFTYRLKPSGLEPVKYLALGDSFSSGEGAYTYRSPTDFYIDDNNYNLCHLSKNSYPYLIQKTQSFGWFNSIACSGAQIGDIGSQDSVAYLGGYSQAKTPQRTASHLSNALENFIPGYAPQIKFNDAYHPTIATISVGGNDFGFGKIIEKCVIGGGDNDILCYFNRDEREKLANSIEDKIPELANLFSKLKASMSGSDPRLYVIGYPEIISPMGICGLNVAMQPSETEFTEHLTQFINQAIKAASVRAGVNYVDVEKAFIKNNEDYRLCGNTKQYAVNGLVFKSEISKKPDRIAYSESYHPNQLGQSLLATAIIGATSDLTLLSSELNPSAAIPVSSRISLVGDAQILYPNLKIKLAEDLSSDTLFKEDQVNINLRLKPEDAKPSVGSSVVAEIHSEPISLGNLQFSDNAITGSVVIPNTISVGYHELHVIYDDIQGNKVDLYKYIYVASSANDFDGDGVDNDSDPCLATVQSGIDQDDDGIDDSCDGEYVKSPTTTNNNNATKATNDKSAPKYAHEFSVYLSSNTKSDIFSTPDAAFQFQSQNKKTYDDNESSSNIKQSQKKQENYGMIILSVLATVATLSAVIGGLLKKNG